VAGGGFSGVELAAGLADFLVDTRKFYPRLAGQKLHLLLVHHGQRLLEELDEESAAYTLRLLRRQGIGVRLGTAVTRVAANEVDLNPGGTIATQSVFWTAGVTPSPLVQSLPLPKDRHGAVVVDGHLAVQGHPGVWAIGDCASIPNPHDGGTYAPLAQNAEREGPVVAANVLASLHGQPLQTFDYELLGTFASLGHRTAVGKVMGRRFSGLPAWLMWRAVYLSKLPGWDRKARVGTDWLLDFVLPPDLVAMHADELVESMQRRSDALHGEASGRTGGAPPATESRAPASAGASGGVAVGGPPSAGASGSPSTTGSSPSSGAAGGAHAAAAEPSAPHVARGPHGGAPA